MNEESLLLTSLDRATTWSGYLDSMLSGAITLTNAAADPVRAHECVRQAMHGASQLVSALSEYLQTVEHLSKPEAPTPTTELPAPIA